MRATVLSLSYYRIIGKTVILLAVYSWHNSRKHAVGHVGLFINVTVNNVHRFRLTGIIAEKRARLCCKISMWLIQVFEYKNAIKDVASFASRHVLWVDSSSNYAVYNAAGVTCHRPLLAAV